MTSDKYAKNFIGTPFAFRFFNATNQPVTSRLAGTPPLAEWFLASRTYAWFEPEKHFQPVSALAPSPAQMLRAVACQS
jgi:hypothetical protein